MKRLILIAICFIITLNVFSQAFEPALKIGYSISNFSSKEYESEPQKAICSGFYFHIKAFNENLDFLTDWTILKTGMRASGLDYLNQIKNINLNVWELKFSMIGDYYFYDPMFSLQGGIYAAIGMVFNDSEGILLGANKLSSSDILDNAQGIGYGLLAGVATGSKNIRLSIRYFQGLRNLYKDYSSENYKVYAHSIQIELSYSFSNVSVVRKN